jgi:homoserine kinase
VSDVRHHHVQVPATTANLGPGFDAFGLALTRYLAVRSVAASPGGPRVATRGDGADELSDGDDNLIWRSFVAGCDAFGAPVPDVAFEAVNDVPLERGLGSSSAAIVAGLVLARALTGVAVADHDLVVLADGLEGHPDNVAPALLGGLVACARRDDGSLVVRRRNPAPHLRPLVLVPTTRQATTSARAVLPASLPAADVAGQAARAGHVLAGLAGAWSVDAGLAGDLLHEPARFAVMEATGAAVRELRDHGIHAWLSGAGPSAAAFVTSADGHAAEVLERVSSVHGFAASVLRVDLAGALACPDDGCAIAGVGGCVQCPRQRVC